MPTTLLAQATTGTDPSTLIVGIGSLVVALATAYGLFRASSKRKGDDNHEADDGLQDAARGRIRILADTITDLEGQLRDCRAERVRLTRENAEHTARAHLADRTIGDLERRLADARAELERRERRHP